MKKIISLIALLLTSVGTMADTNVTNSYIENPNFEARFAGWINNGFYYVTNSSFARKNGMVYMERWVASGSKIPNVEISQDLYLPTGTYRLTAGCQNVQQSGSVQACRGATLYAGGEKVTVTEAKDYSLTFTVLQGVTRIGFKVSSTNANWAAIDHVRLYRLDTDVAAELAELQKLTDEAETVLADAPGDSELEAAIGEAKALIEAGTDEGIGDLAKRLSDATLNHRILNATGTAPKITTNPFVAAGATVLLGRMTLSKASGIKEKGFCWSTSPEPTIFDNRSTNYFSANGEIYRMEKLTPGTTYYVRPYAITSSYMLVYGDIIKAPTLPKGQVTADYDNGGSTEQNYRIASATEEIKWLYNNVSSVRGINISVHYSAGTPTADCSYGGWMRVGPNEAYQQTGTLLHETNHGVGVGTSNVWWDGNYRQDGNRGKWLGRRATQMIQFLNKDNAAFMTGDDTHMWPSSSVSGPNYGINGSWEDSYNPENTLLYYGNVLITHAMHQDGLVCSSSVGFASPAYTFAQDDETKYYIKTTDSECGNGSTLLYAASTGNVVNKTASAATAKADDGFAWHILYDAKTAQYYIQNVGTGKLLSMSSQKLKVVSRNTPSNNERVQLLPSRSNFQKGQLDTPSYWITISKKAVNAVSKQAVGIADFDASDANAKQHWLLLDEEEMTAFDEFCTQQAMPQLDSILAEASRSMEVPCVAASEGTSIEEVALPMNNLLSTILAEKDGYSVDDIENAIEDIRTTFIAYLENAQPASPYEPIPASWLIENRTFDENASGWTKGPETIQYGVAEFLEQTFNTYQTLPTLPAGNYVVTVNAFQRPGTNKVSHTDWKEGNNAVKAQLYATGGTSTESQTIQNIWDGGSETKKKGQCVTMDGIYIPNNVQAADSWFSEGFYENRLSINMPKASTLRIGLRSTKSDTSWWTCFDNFGLLFYGIHDGTTGLKAIDNEELIMDNDIYDLSGRKIVNGKMPNGIYIRGGKKILVK